MSHTALEGDQHEYWFDDLGTAANPFGDDVPPAEPQVPVLESISPSYQCYPDHYAGGGAGGPREGGAGGLGGEVGKGEQAGRTVLLWAPAAGAGRGVRSGAALPVGAVAGGL